MFHTYYTYSIHMSRHFPKILKMVQDTFKHALDKPIHNVETNKGSEQVWADKTYHRIPDQTVWTRTNFTINPDRTYLANFVLKGDFGQTQI